MASTLSELNEHSAVREVVGVKQDEAQAFALSLLPSLAVPWDTFVSAGLLSDRDVQLIRRFDKRDKFTQAALWEKARHAASRENPRGHGSLTGGRSTPQEGSAYAAVFFNVLRSVSKDDTTQYVLALLEEAFVGASCPHQPRARNTAHSAPPAQRVLRLGSPTDCPMCSAPQTGQMGVLSGRACVS
jgi:hypothetical protein